MPVSTEDPQLTSIIQKALEFTQPLVKQGLADELAFRKKTEIEIAELFFTTQRTIEIALEANVEDIKTKTLQQVHLDLELAKKLNQALEQYKPGLEQCAYPLKFNKLDPILTGTTLFLEEHFTTLFYDQAIPDGYLFKTKDTDVTRIGPNEYTIYGNSKNTFFKTALLETYLAATGCKAYDNNFPNSSYQTGKWVDNTAMAHVAPLPTTLNLLDLDPRFENFTFAFHDTQTPNGLLYTHSGYTFGGDRNRVRGNKQFAPHDCSSWLEKLCGGANPFVFTTGDQLYLHRSKTGKIDCVPKEWVGAATATNMERTFDVVSHWQQDPQKYIEPGQVYCHRGFNLTTDPEMVGAGSGGHTALVLGFKSDAANSQIVTLNYNRDMPNQEGFGVQAFPLIPMPTNKTLMIFSVNGQSASSAKLANVSSALSTESAIITRHKNELN